MKPTTITQIKDQSQLLNIKNMVDIYLNECFLINLQQYFNLFHFISFYFMIKKEKKRN